MAIDTLLPKKLEKSDASYKSVIELNEALSSAEKERIRNIALTGPFGSGKSSVLIILREDFPKTINSCLYLLLLCRQMKKTTISVIQMGNQMKKKERSG